MKDNTNPEHYKQHPSGIECIRITEHYDFNVGNAIKYLWRAGLKGGSDKEIEDLKKAKWYIDNKIKMLDKCRTNTKGVAVCIENKDSFASLTIGKEYDIVKITNEFITILDDDNVEWVFTKSRFKIHEPT